MLIVAHSLMRHSTKYKQCKIASVKPSQTLTGCIFHVSVNVDDFDNTHLSRKYQCQDVYLLESL